MDNFNADLYELKVLTDTELESYQKNLKLYDDLSAQLIYINGLETDNVDEEEEKFEYLLIITNFINKLSKKMLESFYKIKE